MKLERMKAATEEDKEEKDAEELFMCQLITKKLGRVQLNEVQ